MVIAVARPGMKPLVMDALMGAVLVVAAQIEVWTATDARVSASLVAVLGTAPVVMRRWLPMVSLVMVHLPLILLSLERSDSFTYAQLLAMMVATYSIAHECAFGRALTGLGLSIVSALVNSAAASGTDVGDFVFPLILLGGPWMAGRAIRAWGERTLELEKLTRALEAQREESARLAVSAERGKIARDLHDSLAQSLHVVVIHAEAAEEALGKSPDQIRDSLHRIQSVGREALTQAKGMLGLLRSNGVGPENDVQPSLADLDILAESIRSTGLTLDVCVEGHVGPLPKSMDVSAYRIVQESLTNVLKHAQARRAKVVVRYGVDSLELEITDDGRGAPAAPEGTSYGLLGMRERAMILGGSMTTGSVEGGGFGVHVRLPMSGSAR